MQDWKDLTPNYVPAWISDFSNADWAGLLPCDVRRVSLDPSGAWRQQGMMPEFKIKVDCDCGGSVEGYVLKGCKGPMEARVYSSTRPAACPAIPTALRVWLDDSPDEYSWILMVYYDEDRSDSSWIPNMVRSMAVCHAEFWDNAWGIRDQLSWHESSIYPFTSRTSLSAALTAIPSLHAILAREWPLPQLGSRLCKLIDGDLTAVDGLYSFPQTLVHCDLHDGNYINLAGSDIGKIIDWSGACFTVPFFDVMRTVDYLCKTQDSSAEDLYRVYLDRLGSAARQIGGIDHLRAFVEQAGFIATTIHLAACMEMLSQRRTFDPLRWQARIGAWDSLEHLADRVTSEITELS